MDKHEIQLMVITLLKNGINEYQIADILEVRQPTVSRWLSGKIVSLKARNYMALRDLYNQYKDRSSTSCA